ncbi:hypothetical protein O6H91_Y200200 [Diphasiastrum complanatum]|nr:hypothetical protein O6H91_Y200200 [Diphasiastrum complanatum]
MAAVLQLTCLLSGRAISAAAGCRMDKERKCSQLLPRSIVVARAGEGAVTSTGASAELESLPVATPPKVELSKVEAAPTCNPKLNATVTAKTTGTKAIAKKPVQKSLASLMSEDIIPALQKELEKQEGISDLSLKFADNQLQGDFEKNGIRYSFWAYFPDGTLEGSRGFSLSSHGCPPSTIEPFLIDEKKITANLVVFWVMKRLFAQKLLSQN